jgi:hypothetical protein
MTFSKNELTKISGGRLSRMLPEENYFRTRLIKPGIKG